MGREPRPSRALVALLVLLWAVSCAAPGSDRQPTPSTGPTTAARVPTITGQSWVIQLDGIPTQRADMVTMDGADATPDQVAAVTRAGGLPICYLNAGAWEDWRPDADQFDDGLVGKPLAGWPGERWLDVRDPSRLRAVMSARIADCQGKGFVAIDPDNLDGYQADTGFGITQTQEVAYLAMLVDLAHQHGLAIGLKNAVELLPAIGDRFDFAVNESCQQYDECDQYRAFTATGKLVLNLEYTGTLAQVCQPRTGFITVLADRALAGPVKPCD